MALINLVSSYFNNNDKISRKATNLSSVQSKANIDLSLSFVF